MKITRIYTGEDEQSHFEEIEIPLFDQGDIGRLSAVSYTHLLAHET